MRVVYNPFILLIDHYQQSTAVLFLSRRSIPQHPSDF
jgi:hypothetical protein